MHVSHNIAATDRYARCIEVSRRVRWDIDQDVIRGREFDYGHKFLPDGLSLVHELDFLQPDEQRFLSQIQGRTYANIFGLVERFINAKVLELSHHHWFGVQDPRFIGILSELCTDQHLTRITTALAPLM